MPTQPRKTRRLRRDAIKQVGGNGLNLSKHSLWYAFMEPVFRTPRVFFFANANDKKYTHDTLVAPDLFDSTVRDWNYLTQQFCPVEIEADKALLRFRGAEEEDAVAEYDGILALCVSPKGDIEGFAILRLNDDESEFETDILCPGREGRAGLTEEKRALIEELLEEAIEKYNDEAFEDAEVGSVEDDSEEEDEDEY